MPKRTPDLGATFEGRYGANSRALGKTIKALTLGAEHDALVQHAKTLARLIDGFPFEIKLHTEYREVVRRLVEAGTPEQADAFDELMKALRAVPAGTDA